MLMFVCVCLCLCLIVGTFVPLLFVVLFFHFLFCLSHDAYICSFRLFDWFLCLLVYIYVCFFVCCSLDYVCRFVHSYVLVHVNVDAYVYLCLYVVFVCCLFVPFCVCWFVLFVHVDVCLLVYDYDYACWFV